MDTSKAIDFLLENGSEIIQYRLQKDIFKNKKEEERLLKKVLKTSRFVLVKGYQKENGYIGIGMHSWDKYKETPLQDGEAAARLLYDYGIPKNSIIIRRFIKALINDKILEHEFSYYGPELVRLNERFIGNGCGWGLQLLIDTVIAMLGYGDEFCGRFIEISFNVFNSITSLSNFMDIAKYNPESKKKYNYLYLEADQLWPCMYHLETLAHTYSWRNKNAMKNLANSINHLNEIAPQRNYHIRLGSRYYSPCGGFVMPIKPCSDWQDCSRRVLTNIALCGIGKDVTVAKQTAEILNDLLRKDGMIKINFKDNYEKKRFKQGLMYTGPYCEAGLSSSNYRTDNEIIADLTFWAIHFLHSY